MKINTSDFALVIVMINVFLSNRYVFQINMISTSRSIGTRQYLGSTRISFTNCSCKHSKRGQYGRLSSIIRPHQEIERLYLELECFKGLKPTKFNFYEPDIAVFDHLRDPPDARSASTTVAVPSSGNLSRKNGLSRRLKAAPLTSFKNSPRRPRCFAAAGICSPLLAAQSATAWRPGMPTNAPSPHTPIIALRGTRKTSRTTGWPQSDGAQWCRAGCTAGSCQPVHERLDMERYVSGLSLDSHTQRRRRRAKAASTRFHGPCSPASCTRYEASDRRHQSFSQTSPPPLSACACF